MTTIIYLHGFLSSPRSFKAKVTQEWLADNCPEVTFYCPQLSSYPSKTLVQLKGVFKEIEDENIGLIGSSLGGFWATYLVENNFANRAVLVNPAVMPHSRFSDFIGKELQHYHSDESVLLTPQDLLDLESYDCESIKKPESYWLMVQTGDEALDYNLAVEKYLQSEQLIEKGGNHSFENYDQWLPEISKLLGR